MSKTREEETLESLRFADKFAFLYISDICVSAV